MEEIQIPDEYKGKSSSKAVENDIGLLKLSTNLEKKYGYLGIDAREDNAEGGDIEISGYPSDKNGKKDGRNTY